MAAQALLPEAPIQEDWSPQVHMILSALDAAEAEEDRRQHGRQPHRVRAELRLFSDPDSRRPWVIFTRDLNSRGLGFIANCRLPLGYGGYVEFETPDGKAVQVGCTVYRCREAAAGWFEGALHFNRAAVHLDLS